MTLQGRCSLGGRALRYAGGRLLRVTFLDPWTGKHLQFGSRPLADLWMLRQTDVKLRCVELQDVSLVGRQRTLQVLMLTHQCGRTTREAISGRTAVDRTDGLRYVARDELLNRQCEIRNVDLLRRAATQWMDVNAEKSIETIVDLVRREGAVSVAALYGAISTQITTSVDSALSFAWRRRFVGIDLSVPYGRESKVTAHMKGVNP
jgi:hypothetical protein